MKGCLACDLSEGRRELPGGAVYTESCWAVEPCVGPLPVGTLIVKPRRHITHIWELNAEEAAELGPLLARVSGVIQQIAQPDQVYVCLWSHAGWAPGHIHFVLQPVWKEQQAEYPLPGPMLQVELFQANQAPERALVEGFAERARALMHQG